MGHCMFHCVALLLRKSSHELPQAWAGEQFQFHVPWAAMHLRRGKVSTQAIVEQEGSYTYR